ncbi:formate dehydrogenase accessory sulfurtransferase FdhD [Leeia oryzae]|uniref:formate dehydrogenase accessory sulfurtransferase FdhD n=1 Tax=Leeia oryzae TaxID=356662 RepID=UPI000364414D|nr:formate dehydrogenase accessory sulfurtransferase FdhD [Leeia oryzae]
MSKLHDPMANGISLTAEVMVGRSHASGQTLETDTLAAEVPVALVYNGISHVVLMASPVHLAELAIGFSLTEQIIDKRAELFDIEVETVDNGITVNIEISAAAFGRLKERRRNMTGRTGCGLCGTESLDEVWRQLPTTTAVQATAAVPLLDDIAQAFAQMRQRQPLFEQTGATHAAGWWQPEQGLLAVCEDVGRHNALDKLIGRCFAAREPAWDCATGFLLLTSRASVEMVQKAAVMGMKTVITLSAPTSLAVQIAKTCGITLVRYQPAKHALAVFNGPDIHI